MTSKNNNETDNIKNNVTQNNNSEVGASYLQTMAVPSSDGHIIPHIAF